MKVIKQVQLDSFFQNKIYLKEKWKVIYQSDTEIILVVSRICPFFDERRR